MFYTSWNISGQKLMHFDDCLPVQHKVSFALLYRSYSFYNHLIRVDTAIKIHNFLYDEASTIKK